MRIEENQLKEIYDSLFDTMVNMVVKTNNPQVVASTMMAQALRLYKTVFKTEEQFNEVIETVLNNAINIKPFNSGTLH